MTVQEMTLPEQFESFSEARRNGFIHVMEMKKAGKTANEKGIPVVLDPVGAGASSLRNETARQLVEEVRYGWDIARNHVCCS